MTLTKTRKRLTKITRSVTITNTSNWKGEDFEVTYGMPWVIDKRYASKLKPGESIVVGLHEVEEMILSVKPETNGEPKPYYKDGKQVVPIVKVGFEP